MPYKNRVMLLKEIIAMYCHSRSGHKNDLDKIHNFLLLQQVVSGFTSGLYVLYNCNELPCVMESAVLEMEI